MKSLAKSWPLPILCLLAALAGASLVRGPASYAAPAPDDDFASYGVGLNSPARKARAVTPSDSTNLPKVSRGLYIGVTGDVKVMMAGDNAAVTFTNVAVGEHPWCVQQVFSTGTTASGIVEMY